MGIAAAIIVIVAWLLPKNPREWVLLAALAVFSAPYFAYQAWPTGTLIVVGILAALLIVAAFVKSAVDEQGEKATPPVPVESDLYRLLSRRVAHDTATPPVPVKLDPEAERKRRIVESVAASNARGGN